MSIRDFLVLFSNDRSDDDVEMPLDEFYDEYVMFFYGKAEREFFSNVAFGRALTPFEERGFFRRKRSGNRRSVIVFMDTILRTLNPLKGFFQVQFETPSTTNSIYTPEEAYVKYERYCKPAPPRLSLEAFREELIMCEKYNLIKLKTYIFNPYTI